MRDRKSKVIQAALGGVEQRSAQFRIAAPSGQQFVNVLLDRADVPSDSRDDGFTDFMVFLQIAKLERELKPLVEERTWLVMEKLIATAREYEPDMRRLGLLSDDEVIKKENSR